MIIPFSEGIARYGYHLKLVEAARGEATYVCGFHCACPLFLLFVDKEQRTSKLDRSISGCRPPAASSGFCALSVQNRTATFQCVQNTRIGPTRPAAVLMRVVLASFHKFRIVQGVPRLVCQL